ncbi:MAG: ABC transporter ATP-binding protein [Candidatus Omnitrophica bacterium]|nr:ABC transporter ATP-binding protein [Candidatus Omnitrophota bacterium]MCK4423999.1 ABC transporter ATP-binding protein [Candidatus Omnitrophota bacterium]
MKKIIEIKDLSVVYKNGKSSNKALDNLSLEVYEGEIFGFLGPNGAGKTTTIKSLLGFLYPDSGQISVFGENYRDISIRQRIGFMPEIANYYWYLTPVEMLRMYGRFFKMAKQKIDEEIEKLLSLVELEKAKNVLMKNFSKGMMQKVSFAQALINDPELLILDEPAGGLDPMSRMTMRNTILDLKEKGKTIFFSSHELSEVEMISDRIGILNKGKIIKSGQVNELLKEKGTHETLEKYFLNMIRRG